MQRDQVGNHQTKQHQRDRDDVESKKAVERCVRHNIVAANPDGQFGPDEWNGREQVHNDLGAPERHLTPGQEVTKEGFRHQAQENTHTKNPDQFARLAV